MGGGGRRWGWGDPRCLEEEHSPICSAQVEDIGPFAVVCCPHGQRVVDGHSILQILFRQLLFWTVLSLQTNQRAECYHTRPITEWDILLGCREGCGLVYLLQVEDQSLQHDIKRLPSSLTSGRWKTDHRKKVNIHSISQMWFWIEMSYSTAMFRQTWSDL